mgnify:CR=1 FL=1
MEKKPKKKPKKYFCIKCDFSSNDKKDYTRHLSTRKHQKNTMDNKRITKKTEKNIFKCELCDKKYKYRSGLSKHRRTAHPDIVFEENTQTTPTTDINSQVDELKEMMASLVKVQKKTADNFDNLKKMIPKLGNTTYNQKMSINVYLNHHCKDAINIQDFLDNLKISLEDLKYTKEHGYAKGISNIFVKQLKDLKPNERPIHCSDKKRLQFYVKDNNSWERDAQHKKIDSTIQDITIKQIKQLKEWEKAHPNYLKDEVLLKEWHDMVHSVMGGEDIEDKQKQEKIIKKELGITFEMKDDMLENH